MKTKKSRLKSLFAMLLVVSMVCQQSSLTVLATEDTYGEETTVEPTPSESEPEEYAEESEEAEVEEEPEEPEQPAQEEEPQQPEDTENPAETPDSQEPADWRETPATPAPEQPAETTGTPAAEVTEVPAENQPTEAPAEATPTPEVCVAPSETPTPEVTEAPKTSFRYEDSRVVITATAPEDANLPQDAEIKADYIAPGTERYNAAVAAFNSQLGSQLGLDAENTTAEYVLYDVYFLTADGNRIEPESGNVKVDMSFKQIQKSTTEGEIINKDVVHLDNNGQAEVVTEYVNTNAEGDITSMGFSQDSFSIVGGVATYAGEGSNGEQGNDVNYQETTDLSKLLDGVTLEVNSTKTKIENGIEVTLRNNEEISLNLSFKEQEGAGGYQFSTTSQLEYTLPNGFTFPQELVDQEFDINIKKIDNEGTHSITIPGNKYTVRGNKLYINLADNADLKSVANASFSLKLNAKVTSVTNGEKISFGGSKSLTVDLDNKSHVDVEKKITSYDADGTAYYQVVVKSVGTNNNVVVTDKFSSDILICQQDVTATDKNGNGVSLNSNGNTLSEGTDGFTSTIAQMNDGDEITYKYTAIVDYSKVGNGTVSADQKKNTVTVIPNGDDTEKKETSTNYDHEISYNWISKSNGTENADGKSISWTVTVNGDQKQSAAGMVVSDTIEAGSQKYLSYAEGAKIICKVYEGTTLKRTDTIEAGTLGNSKEYEKVCDASGKVIGWKYKIPTSDTKEYKYVFSYDTVLDKGNLVNGATVKNNASLDGKGSTSGSTGITGISVDGKKEVVRLSDDKKTTTWKITVDLPAEALDSLVVTDTLPISDWFTDSEGVNGQKHDSLVADSIKVTGGYYYEPDYSDSTKFVLTFYKDAAHTESGVIAGTADRKIEIEFTTLNNEEWVNKAENDGNFVAHTNTAKIKANGVDIDKSASVNITPLKKKNITKTRFGTEKNAWNYRIVLEGVNEDTITVKDTLNQYMTYIDNDPNYWIKARLEGYSNNNFYYGGGVDLGSPTVNISSDGKTLTFMCDAKKNSENHYYMYYVLYYAVRVDENAIQENASNNNGTYSVTNSASWGQLNTTCTIDVPYSGLTKTVAKADSGNSYVADYTLDINPLAVDMVANSDEIVITDTSENLSVKEDTIRVTKLTDGETLNWSYSINGNLLKFTIANGDGKHIQITYSAKILGSGSVTYKNTAKIEGTSYESSKSEDVTISTSGEGTGSSGTFTILKQDEKDNKVKLAGAEFELYQWVENAGGWILRQNNKNGVKCNFITSDNGSVEVAANAATDRWSLTPGKYKIKEIKAPSGYPNTPLEYEFELKNVLTGDDNEFSYGSTIVITNDKSMGNLKLIKTFIGDNALTDARKDEITFTITGPNNYNKTIRFSDFTGEEYLLDNLLEGEYTVTEANADVDGYTRTTTYSVAGGKTRVVKGQDAVLTVTNSYTRDKGSLELEKVFAGGKTAGDLTDAQKEAILFTITGPDGYSKVVKYSEFTDGKYKLTDLPTGEYQVTESGADFDKNYSLAVSYSVTDGKVAVTKDQTAGVIVTNTYSKEVGNLIVAKEISGLTLTDEQKQKLTFTVTGPNYQDSKSYNEFVNGSWELTNLPEGEYTVTETNADVEGYTRTTTYSVAGGKTRVEKGQDTVLTVTNSYTRDKGSLELEKKFAGGKTAEDLTDAQKVAIFFTITGPDGYSKVVKYSEFTDGKYKLTDLPTGEYQVTESGADFDKNYSLAVSYNVTDGKVAVTKDKPAGVIVTNTYSKKVGNLIVAKEISGLTLTDEQKQKLTFTVTGPNYQDSKSYNEFVNGSWELTNLPEGEYTVTETNADVEGYTRTTTYSVAGGKTRVEKGQDTVLTVTNSYTRDKGSLELEKKFAGGKTAEDLTDAQKVAIFFTITGPDGYSKVVKYSEFTDGKYKLTDLPTGEYQVTESGADFDKNYSLAVSYNVTDGKVAVTKDKPAGVIVTNTYSKKVGNLIVAKEISGLTLTDEQKQKLTFTVTGPNYQDSKSYNEFVNGSWELTNLPEGEYTVTEANADVEGYTRTTTYSVAGGKTRVEKGQDTVLTVTNSYTRDKGSLELEKKFAGGKTAEDLTDAQKVAILFTITGPDGYSKVVKYSEFTDGKYKLTDLPTGEYQVTESGADFDKNYSLAVRYNVTDGKVAVTKDQTARVTVTNTYFQGSITLGATKSYNKSLNGADFEFLLEQVADANGTPITDATPYTDSAKNDKDGKVTFAKINYTAEGTYYYKISEKNGGSTIKGTTYDENSYIVTVTVKRDGDKLTASADKAIADIKFTNTYSATGNLDLTAHKTLTSKEKTLKDVQFTFDLLDDSEEVIDSATNDENGNIVFKQITYKLNKDTNETGTYQYTVREQIPDSAEPTTTETGYTYDSTIYTIDVTVKDAENGTLTVTPVIHSSKATSEDATVSGMEFTNTYTTSGQIVLSAFKTLDGQTLNADQFSFTATEIDAEGKLVENGYKETVKNADGGAITFPVITYEKSGTYYYQITEANEESEKPAYKFDASKYVVTVNVTDDNAGNLTAAITAVTKDGVPVEAVTFTNTYTASADLELKATKSMKSESDELGTFQFELKDADGNVIETVENDEKGVITFSKLSYDEKAAGKTFTYTVNEKVPEEADTYIYDKTVYTVTVDVTDNRDGSLKLTTKVNGEDYTETAMKFVNDTTKVTISKVDDTSKKALAGAKLQVVDKEDKVVEEWTSDGTPHMIAAKLVLGATYKLVEIEAPKGYEIADPITFTVDADDTKNAVEMQDAMTKSATAAIEITKELKLNDELAGATDMTFYAALFADPECTILASDVKALEFKNASSSTVEFTGLDLGRTYYVSETDADGNAIESGVTPDGKVYTPAYPQGKEITVTEDGAKSSITFENQFSEWPDGFYKIATLTVTKELLGADGNALDSDEVFYAGIFDDKECTTLSTRTEFNVLALDLAGGSTVSASVQAVVMPGDSFTLYVAETDADGNPVDEDAFAYAVNVSENGTVYFDENNLNKEIKITNQEKPEATPTVTPEETPTPTPTTSTGVKTGDDTPIGFYMALLFIAVLAIEETTRRRRKKEN